MSRSTSFDVQMVGEGTYVPGQAPVVLTSGQQKKKFQLKPRTIWLIAFFILLGVIIVTIILCLGIKQETIEVPYDAGVVNLDILQNLDDGGLCCELPSMAITDRYVYLPSTNFTYSTDELAPTVACQGLTGTAYTSCINLSTNDSGGPAPVAHKGIKVYYTYTSGQATNTCNSFLPCV